MKTNTTPVLLGVLVFFFFVSLTYVSARYYPWYWVNSTWTHSQNLSWATREPKWQGKGNEKYHIWNRVSTGSIQTDHHIVCSKATLATPLTQIQIQGLIKQYQDEQLAHDTYQALYEIYWVKTFSNIASSESTHQLEIEKILTTYKIAVPKDLGTLQDTYQTLLEQWKKSLAEAYQVGLKIEMLDIDDIESLRLQFEESDITCMLDEIKTGSYHHLSAFSRKVTQEWGNLPAQIEKYQAQMSATPEGTHKKSNGKWAWHQHNNY